MTGGELKRPKLIDPASDRDNNRANREGRNVFRNLRENVNAHGLRLDAASAVQAGIAFLIAYAVAYLFEVL